MAVFGERSLALLAAIFPGTGRDAAFRLRRPSRKASHAPAGDLLDERVPG